MTRPKKPSPKIDRRGMTTQYVANPIKLSGFSVQHIQLPEGVDPDQWLSEVELRANLARAERAIIRQFQEDWESRQLSAYLAGSALFVGLVFLMLAFFWMLSQGY